MNSVRAYLLGTLPDDQAAVVELKYFTDPSFFSEVQIAEQVLIDDYLKGRLTPTEKGQFESRYQRVPQLQQAVEERRRRVVTGAFGVSLPLRLVIAGALIGGVGLSGWIYLHQQKAAAPVAVAPQPAPSTQRAAILNLVPGLKKGEGASSAQLKLLSSPFPVNIHAELPGQRSTVACSAVISHIGDDGVFEKVWASPEPIQSTPIPGGQQVIVTLDSSVFRPGDCILRLSSTDGTVSETYVFRVK